MARGVPFVVALRNVMGEATHGLSEDALKARASRLARSLGSQIAARRRELAARGEAAEEAHRPLGLGELLGLANAVTIALSQAIAAGERHGVPHGLLIALRRAVGQHTGRVQRLPIEALPEPTTEGAPGFDVIDRLTATYPVCTCEAST